MTNPPGGGAMANPRDAEAVSEAQALDTLAEAQGFTLFRTSGSSGRPKWVALTAAALAASALAVNRHLRTASDDCWLRVLPRFHVGGYAIPVRARLADCRLEESDEKWHPESFVRLCGRSGATLCSLVPTQVHDLVTAQLRAPAALRAVVVGGGELRPSVWAKARALGWPLLTSYGLSEAASQVATLALEVLDDPNCDPARLTLLPHWQARLDEADVLQLQGPSLFSGYFSCDGAGGSWRFSPADGWFSTRDRVTLCGSTLRFLGRRDAVVKILGELVDVAEIERRLADLVADTPARGRLRVVAVPDERSGNVLVLESALDEQKTMEILSSLNAALPPFAVVREVRCVASIPLSPLGKPLAPASSRATDSAS